MGSGCRGEGWRTPLLAKYAASSALATSGRMALQTAACDSILALCEPQLQELCCLGRVGGGK